MDHRLMPDATDMCRKDMELRYLEGDTNNAQIHAHPFLEIFFFLEGPVERYVVGGKSYHLRPGDILMLPAGIPHYPVFQQKLRPYRRYVLWLAEEYLQKLDRTDPGVLTVFKNCEQQGVYRIRCKTTVQRNLLESYLDAMWKEEQSSSSCKIGYLYSLSLSFLVQLNRSAADEQIQSPKHSHTNHLDRVLSYIHEHYTEPLTLKQVADHFYTSPSNIELLLRNKAKKPFYRYVTECRIIHAQLLIAEGIPLKEVGIACGYNDYSNFYRAFTKEAGISPSQYRKHLPTDHFQIQQNQDNEEKEIQ